MAPPISPLERQTIVTLRREGLFIKEIERRTGISRKTIRLWLKRDEETGGFLVANQRKNYQRATTAEQDAAIVLTHTEQPCVPTHVTASQYSISRETVRRRLIEAKKKMLRPHRNERPPKVLKRNAIPSVFPSSQFSQELCHASQEQSSSQVFDPSKVQATYSKNRYVCAECDSKMKINAEELYRCVQCPLLLMCGKCGRDNAHAHHCVLRIPSLLVYKKVENIFKTLSKMFNNKLPNSKEGDDNNIKDQDPAASTVMSDHRDVGGVNSQVTRIEPVIGLSQQLSAGEPGSINEPLIFVPEVKSEPDPLDPEPLTPTSHGTLTTSHEPRTKKRKVTMPYKQINNGLKVSVVRVERWEPVEDKVKKKVENQELKDMKLLEVKDEPPDYDLMQYNESQRTSETNFGS